MLSHQATAIAVVSKETMQTELSSKVCDLCQVCNWATTMTFIKLKEKFSSTPTLRYFNPEKAIHLETDASAFTITGILSQQGTRESEVDWCQSTSTIVRDMAMH